MDVFDSIGAWGNLNAIVYFQSPRTQFYSIVNELAMRFGAHEVLFSSFDLENGTVGFDKPESLGDNIIVLAILSKDKEAVHIEQLGDLCSVEHLFRPRLLEQETGSATMRTIINDYLIVGWVLGFELSIHIQSVRQSFETIWQDPSQYPLIVFEQGKDNVPKEYGAYEPMLTMLHTYLTRIS